MEWSPMAGGRLFGPANDAARRITDAARGMAARYDGATLEQLAYAWILAHPARPLPILGTNRIERIKSAAAAAEIVLQREDWYALWEAAQGRRVP
jgi:predicted oxidoreductase